MGLDLCWGLAAYSRADGRQAVETPRVGELEDGHLALKPAQGLDLRHEPRTVRDIEPVSVGEQTSHNLMWAQVANPDAARGTVDVRPKFYYSRPMGIT